MDILPTKKSHKMPQNKLFQLMSINSLNFIFLFLILPDIITLVYNPPITVSEEAVLYSYTIFRRSQSFPWMNYISTKGTWAPQFLAHQLRFCSWHTEAPNCIRHAWSSMALLIVNHIHYTPCLAKIYIEIQSLQANYICKAPFGLAKHDGQWATSSSHSSSSDVNNSVCHRTLIMQQGLIKKETSIICHILQKD